MISAYTFLMMQKSKASKLKIVLHIQDPMLITTLLASKKYPILGKKKRKVSSHNEPTGF